jgi:hypothetical protein
MPIVTQCTVPGCETLTMGPLCVEHDLPVTRVFVRGRPFEDRPAPVAWRYTPATTTLAVPSFRRASERVVAARSHR